MAIPKMKLYRLDQNYSPDNDTDLKAVTDDELYPFVEKALDLGTFEQLVGVTYRDLTVGYKSSKEYTQNLKMFQAEGEEEDGATDKKKTEWVNCDGWKKGRNAFKIYVKTKKSDNEEDKLISNEDGTNKEVSEQYYRVNYMTQDNWYDKDGIVTTETASAVSKRRSQLLQIEFGEQLFSDTVNFFGDNVDENSKEITGVTIKYHTFTDDLSKKEESENENSNLALEWGNIYDGTQEGRIGEYDATGYSAKKDKDGFPLKAEGNIGYKIRTYPCRQLVAQMSDCEDKTWHKDLDISTSGGISISGCEGWILTSSDERHPRLFERVKVKVSGKSDAEEAAAEEAPAEEGNPETGDEVSFFRELEQNVQYTMTSIPKEDGKIDLSIQLSSDYYNVEYGKFAYPKEVFIRFNEEDDILDDIFVPDYLNYEKSATISDVETPQKKGDEGVLKLVDSLPNFITNSGAKYTDTVYKRIYRMALKKDAGYDENRDFLLNGGEKKEGESETVNSREIDFASVHYDGFMSGLKLYCHGTLIYDKGTQQANSPFFVTTSGAKVTLVPKEEVIREMKFVIGKVDGIGKESDKIKDATVTLKRVQPESDDPEHKAKEVILRQKTDEKGEASFKIRAAAEYDLTITAKNYETKTVRLTQETASQLSHEVHYFLFPKKTRTVKFTICHPVDGLKLSEAAVKDAVITMKRIVKEGDESVPYDPAEDEVFQQTTDEKGQATFYLLTDSDYDYTVTAEGYETRKRLLSTKDAPRGGVLLKLKPKRKLTFMLFEKKREDVEDNSTNPGNGATGSAGTASSGSTAVTPGTSQSAQESPETSKNGTPEGSPDASPSGTPANEIGTISTDDESLPQADTSSTEETSPSDGSETATGDSKGLTPSESSTVIEPPPNSDFNEFIQKLGFTKVKDKVTVTLKRIENNGDLKASDKPNRYHEYTIVEDMEVQGQTDDGVVTFYVPTGAKFKYTIYAEGYKLIKQMDLSETASAVSLSMTKIKDTVDWEIFTFRGEHKEIVKNATVQLEGLPPQVTGDDGKVTFKIPKENGLYEYGYTVSADGYEPRSGTLKTLVPIPTWIQLTAVSVLPEESNDSVEKQKDPFPNGILTSFLEKHSLGFGIASKTVSKEQDESEPSLVSEPDGEQVAETDAEEEAEPEPSPEEKPEGESNHWACGYRICAYEKTKIAKEFVSSFRNWVSDHLNNNPDIFIGFQGYEGSQQNKTGISYVNTGFSILHREGSVLFSDAITQADLNDVRNWPPAGAEVTNARESENLKIYLRQVYAKFAYYDGIMDVTNGLLREFDIEGGMFQYKMLEDPTYGTKAGDKRWILRNDNKMPTTFFYKNGYLPTPNYVEAGDCTLWTALEMKSGDTLRLNLSDYRPLAIKADGNGGTFLWNPDYMGETKKVVDSEDEGKSDNDKKWIISDKKLWEDATENGGKTVLTELTKDDYDITKTVKENIEARKRYVYKPGGIVPYNLVFEAGEDYLMVYAKKVSIEEEED